jgi:tetratricopeptide (TPR) repeat protein
MMKNRNFAIFVVFFIFFTIYTSSLAPTFNSDDSPETSTAYFTLGIQHPPGYPLATVIGRIFMNIPLATPAFRANLMALFFSLLTAFLVFKISFMLISGIKFGEKNSGAVALPLLAAALYLFSGSDWLQGIIGKGSIYALNAFLLSVCIYFLIRIKEGSKNFYMFAFIYGISMGNHWTSMAVILPAILYFVFAERKYLNARVIFAAMLFFLIGLSIYLYVPIRNITGPVYAWGDVKTLKDFLWLISRAQYSGAGIDHSLRHTLILLKFYITNLFTFEYPFGAPLFMFLGSALLVYKKRTEGILFLSAYFLIIISVALFATPPPDTEWITKPYLVSTNIFASIFAVYAVNFILKSLLSSVQVRNITAVVIASIFTIFLIIHNNPAYDRYYIGYDYAKNMMKSIKKDSIIFLEGDMNVGAMLYESLIEKEQIVPVIPVVLQYDWYRRQLAKNYGDSLKMAVPAADIKDYISAIAAANSGKDIYYSNVFSVRCIDPKMLMPDGIVLKMFDIGKPPVVSDFLFDIYSYRGLIGDKVKHDEFTQRLVMDNYGRGFFNLADMLRNSGNFVQAAGFYEKGLIFAKNHGAYINAGLCFYYAGAINRAAGMWQQAIENNPNDSTAYSDMAYVYIARKDIIMAGEFVKKALQLDPNNQTAINLQKNLK